MMRLVSMCSGDVDEVAENGESGVAGLFNVELHAEDVGEFDGGCEGAAVFRDAGGVGGDRAAIRVSEVGEGFVRCR